MMGLRRIIGGRGVGQHDVIPGWVAQGGPGEVAGSTSCHFVWGEGVGLANMMRIKAEAFSKQSLISKPPLPPLPLNETYHAARTRL